MISFKLSPGSHRALRRLSKKFFTFAYVVALVGLVFFAASEYRSANAILADATIVDAPVEIEDITEQRRRRGRVSVTYHFAYNFEANGQTYRGTFETPESNADKYTEAGTVKIAYANADPSRFDKFERLEGQGSLGSWLKRFAFIALFGAFVAALLHLMLVEKLFVPRKAEPEPQPAG